MVLKCEEGCKNYFEKIILKVCELLSDINSIGIKTFLCDNIINFFKESINCTFECLKGYISLENYNNKSRSLTESSTCKKDEVSQDLKFANFECVKTNSQKLKTL